jgi:hypothetical protein
MNGSRLTSASWLSRRSASTGGRTVKNTGDGLLAEFASVVDAVRCAVEVQRGMAEREPEVPEEQRVRLTDRTRSPRPQRAFTSRLPAVWSPSLPLGITTTWTGLLVLAGRWPSRLSTRPARCIPCRSPRR